MSPPSPGAVDPSQPPRREARLLLAGGLLWLVAYGLSVPLIRESSAHRVEASASWMGWTYFATFAGATLCLGAGLAGLHARLWRQSKTSLVGLGLALLAATASGFNLLRLTGVMGAVEIAPTAAGLGVMGNCASAMLLGLATWRERALARGPSIALLATGSLTVGLLLATPVLLGVAPSYLVDDLPFALAGAAWFTQGALLHARPWRG